MYLCPLSSVTLPIVPSAILVLASPIIFTCILDVVAIIILFVVVVVVAVVVAHCHFWFVWVMQPLLSLVGTYFPIVYTILAHMAQWLSAHFTVLLLPQQVMCSNLKKDNCFFMILN